MGGERERERERGREGGVASTIPYNLHEEKQFLSFFRFIKRLCNFFKPSCHVFSTIPFSEVHQKKYSTVGKLLVKYLCSAEEVRGRREGAGREEGGKAEGKGVE